MKKINAVCGLILTAIITGHIITTSYCFATMSYFPKLIKGFAYCTMLFVIIHALISISIMFFRTDGASLNKYRKLNVRTIIQRASCIFIVLLVHFHVNAYSFTYSGEPFTAGDKAFTIVTQLLFFAAILTHTAVSFSRSLITLGLIRSEKAEKTADIIAYVYCGVLMVTAVACIIPGILAF